MGCVGFGNYQQSSDPTGCQEKVSSYQKGLQEGFGNPTLFWVPDGGDLKG